MLDLLPTMSRETTTMGTGMVEQTTYMVVIVVVGRPSRRTCIKRENEYHQTLKTTAVHGNLFQGKGIVFHDRKITYNIKALYYILHHMIGIYKHSFFGESRIYTQNEIRILEIREDITNMSKWLNDYENSRKYLWNYCLMPRAIANDEVSEFITGKKKLRVMKRIIYQCYFITLREQLNNRGKKNCPFSSEEIVYILYCVAEAWMEWDRFCKQKGFVNTFFAISSQHVLLNEYGEVKIITPYTSPLPLPSTPYLAPENLPPNQQKPENWNKSINFSLGLIGSELITLKAGSTFYQTIGNRMKFNFDEFSKWFLLLRDHPKPHIYRIVALLVDQNPWVRLKLGEFLALLGPYEQSIMEMNDLTLSKAQCRKSLRLHLQSKYKQ